MFRGINGQKHSRSVTGIAQLALAYVALASPAVGLAATTDVSIDNIDGHQTLVIFCGGAGIINRIAVNQTFQGTKYTVSEGPNSTIVAGPGCALRVGSPNVVDCNSAGVTHSRVFLLDGADIYEHNTQLFTMVLGGSGNDNITTGCGVDVVFGESGNDTIIDQGLCGGFGFSCTGVSGQLFHNCLNGGADNDTIKGPVASSNDELVGDGGKDTLLGRGGNDKLLADDDVTGETVDCGPGVDTFTADPGDKLMGCTP